jgi:hypothetical protein
MLKVLTVRPVYQMRKFRAQTNYCSHVLGTFAAPSAIVAFQCAIFITMISILTFKLTRGALPSLGTITNEDAARVQQEMFRLLRGGRKSIQQAAGRSLTPFLDLDIPRH